MGDPTTSVRIPEGIRRSMQILATHRALFGRHSLTQWGRRTMTEADIKLDRERMIELSRLVDPGAETEFRELIRKIERGEPIAI